MNPGRAGPTARRSERVERGHILLYDGLCGFCEGATRVIARHRHRLFRRYDECPIPDREVSARFMDRAIFRLGLRGSSPFG